MLLTILGYKIGAESTTESTPNNEKSNAMQYCNKRVQNDAFINYAERWQYRRSQYAILHQFTVFALILTLGDFLRHSIIHQTLYLAADATSLALVAETDVYIQRSERIGQSSITYPRLLLVRATRRILRQLIVIVLLTNSLKVILLES